MSKKYLYLGIAVLLVVVASILLLKGQSKPTPSPNTTQNIIEEQQILEDRTDQALENVKEALKTEGVIGSSVQAVYTDQGFSPKQVSVKVGDTVTWTNNSEKGMWVASAVHPTHDIYPEFDQLKSVDNSGQYSFTFTKAGNWNYHNHLSPQDTGTVIVSE